MTDELELCPDCDGVGTVEDGKGKEHTCKSCRGKGVVKLSELSIYEPGKTKRH